MPIIATIYLSLYGVFVILGAVLTISDRPSTTEWVIENFLHLAIALMALGFWMPELLINVPVVILVVVLVLAILWEPFSMYREAKSDGGLEPKDRRSRIEFAVVMVTLILPAYIMAGMGVYVQWRGN